MKRLALAAALALLAAVRPASGAGVEEQVARIRAEVEAIHREAGTFETRTVEVEDVALEGAEATCHSSGERLRKVTARLWGETWKASLELFYVEGDLVFAFRRTSRYDGQIGLETPPTVAAVEERRSYFSGGSLIRLLVGREAVAPGSQAFVEDERETKALGATFREACGE